MAWDVCSWLPDNSAAQRWCESISGSGPDKPEPVAVDLRSVLVNDLVAEHVVKRGKHPMLEAGLQWAASEFPVTDALKQAFNIKTIGDLGRNKYIVAAVAIASLAGSK